MAEKLIRCSFCGKTQAQVKRIMSGPNAYICNECVELCSTILHEEMYETGSSELAVQGRKYACVRGEAERQAIGIQRLIAPVSVRIELAVLAVAQQGVPGVPNIGSRA